MTDTDTEKVRILIVDDVPANLTALEAVLAGPTTEIVKAASADEALRHLLEEEFAAILLDVKMPGMDGFELAALIRERKLSASTPIIFVTAQARSFDEMYRGYSLGVVDYILKPFIPDILKFKVAVFLDLYRTRKQLIQLATHDYLTGLPNRRLLDDFIVRAVARAQRGDKSSLLYMDIDNFKTINDVLGHETGDEVLKVFAGLCRKELRIEDVMARLGGDEFAVLLDGQDREAATIAAERLRSAVADHPFVPGGEKFRITLCIGLIEIDGSLDRIELLARADQAMYRAKQNGRNRVMLAEE